MIIKKHALLSLCIVSNFLVQNALAQQGQNTPASTGGANYNEEVVTGLDEYKQRKKILQEKTEQIKSEQKKQAETEYKKKMYEASLKAAQEREAERIKNQKPTKDKGLNSNQEYFDRQTGVLEKNSW